MKKPCLNKTMKNEDIMNKISLLRQPSENGSFNPRFIVSSSFPLTPVAPLTFVCAKETKTRPLPVPLCEGDCQAEAGRPPGLQASGFKYPEVRVRSDDGARY